MTTQYSTIQKLSLAGMVIGSLMCIVGALAPYWIVSDPQGFELGSLVGSVVKGHLGLFMYCAEVLGHSECEAIEMTESGWFHTARVGAAGCVLLGMLCGSISLCLACCNCCKRFVVLGILSFLAAACGAYGAVVFCNNTDLFTSSIMGFKLTSYGWGLYLFCTGVAILGLVSFSSCFSAPESRLRGMILGAPAAGGNIIVSNSTSTTMGQHPYLTLQEQGGPPTAGGFSSVNSQNTVVTSNGY